MRIAIVADACDPPTNGVSRTLRSLADCLARAGDQVRLISPPEFTTVPCPTQPDIRLAVAPGPRLARLLESFAPDAIHIATEGPLGISARQLCLRRRWAFTTMFTSKFAETVQARTRIPAGWTWSLLRWFHAPANAVMVSTESLLAELANRGFGRLKICSRGVDSRLFRPQPEAKLPHASPIWLYVGRVAPEKDIHRFLSLDLPGTKLVVGDGPARMRLQQDFPEAIFVGTKRGEELARYYAACDAFVFPSQSDTFGLVVLEALACGLPVAAFPVTGPMDIIGNSNVGLLDWDLGRAARESLSIRREACAAYARQFSWERCAADFRDNLVPIGCPRTPDQTSGRAGAVPVGDPQASSRASR